MLNARRKSWSRERWNHEIYERVPQVMKAHDLEARARDDHHDALRLWLRLLTCTQIIEKDVRTQLRHDFATTLPRFDLLAQLERHPAGMMMSALSEHMMVTGGNITSIVVQLESEGLVARSEMNTDRRARLIKLTALGRKAFARMAATHERWIIAAMAGLSKNEIATLHGLLGKVKSHLRHDSGTSMPRHKSKYTKASQGTL
jgi:DNA-binding MarR family transcriptional regulator